MFMGMLKTRLVYGDVKRCSLIHFADGSHDYDDVVAIDKEDCGFVVFFSK